MGFVLYLGGLPFLFALLDLVEMRFASELQGCPLSSKSLVEVSLFLWEFFSVSGVLMLSLWPCHAA